jgi:hypothetical protein
MMHDGTRSTFFTLSLVAFSLQYHRKLVVLRLLQCCVHDCYGEHHRNCYRTATVAIVARAINRASLSTSSRTAQALDQLHVEFCMSVLNSVAML